MRHEARTQDSLATESQGVLYDQNHWNQRDELEEEELRLRLRIIELQTGTYGTREVKENSSQMPILWRLAYMLPTRH
jgi:hypothetical protein